MKSLRLLLIASFMFGLSLCAFGFTSPVPYGVVLYARGSNVSVIRRNDMATYDLGQRDIRGLPLFQGDFIQTGPDTLVEVQFFPSSAMVLIPENTNFRINTLTFHQPVDLELVFGKIRTRVTGNGTFPGFRIQNQNGWIELTTGNVGIEFTLAQQGRSDLVFRGYTFSGTAQVFVQGADSDQALLSPVRLGANQSITLPQQDHVTELPVPQALTQSIRSYWNERPFTSGPVELGDLDRQHPGLKVALLQFLEIERNEKLRWEVRQGIRTIQETQRIIRQDILPSPAFADTQVQIPLVGAYQLLPESPLVYTVNTGRVLGSTFTGLGAVSGVAAAAVLVWGEQVFGVPASQIPGVSLTFMLGAVGGFTLGLPLYFLNLK